MMRETPDGLSQLDAGPPLLVIFGTPDALIPAQSTKRFDAAPGLKRVMIDGAGHSPPANTLDLIRDFID